MAAEDRNGEVVSTQGECPDCSTRESSFDELAKGLADGKLTRRKALRMLGGVLLGGAMASVPGMAWAAKPGPCPKKCGKHCCPDATFVCSAGKCTCPAGTTNVGTTCCPNAEVCGTSCGCSAGEDCCRGACTPLNTVANCGSCGNTCQAPANASATCVGGQCGFVCKQGFTQIGNSCCPSAQACGQNCLATACNPANCEVCDPASGQCISTCALAEGCCSGACTPLNTDQNCGSCGNACSGGKTCQQGGVCACPQGQTECGGVCRDLTTDVANCGLCGNVCAQGASCVGGQCACPSGQELCVGTNRCVQGCSATSGEVFNPTTCRCECPGGTTLCNGNCINTQTDPTNCGTCNNACPTGMSCVGGQCVCSTGTTLCGGSCVNLQTDEANCGSCGNACSGGNACIGGQCVAVCPAVSCCCVCNYQYFVNGMDNYIFVCSNTNTTLTRDQCVQSCQSATPPPGTTLISVGHACESGSSGFQRLCQPTTSPNATGTVCSRPQCTPPPT